MPQMTLLPHQVEAVDRVVRHLQPPADGCFPSEGLRAEVVAATGSDKTLIAVEAARRLSARRVLVVVPGWGLDRMMQAAAAWRSVGREGAMVGASSFHPLDTPGLPCTGDPGELVSLVEDLEVVTVFEPYEPGRLGAMPQAHELGLAVWDLIVVDEVHLPPRVVGAAWAGPWAVVNDQERIPAVRRLYMTTAETPGSEGDRSGLESEGESGQQSGRQGQADPWAAHLAAARRFHAREGHLRVPRDHVEEAADESGEDGLSVRLGEWLDHIERRADELTAEGRMELSELGMRWYRMEREELIAVLQSNGSERARAAAEHLRAGAKFEVWSGRRASARHLFDVWASREQFILEDGRFKPGLAEAVRALHAAGGDPICLGAIYPAERSQNCSVFLAGDLTRCIACM